MSNHNFIKLKNVSKTYINGHEMVRAINNVTLTIEEGEFVAITGMSGSGKSTLLKILGCLDNCSSGQYFYNDLLINFASNKQLTNLRRSDIGFIFQDYNLINRLSVVDNVALPLIYSGICITDRNNIAEEKLGIVGLSERLKHMPNQLSGGEQQRVAIARALAKKPKIILADEPTGNLDTENSNIIMTILKNLNQQGITVVMVTHEHNAVDCVYREIKLVDGRLRRKDN